jgi:hypothetical protein
MNEKFGHIFHIIISCDNYSTTLLINTSLHLMYIEITLVFLKLILFYFSSQFFSSHKHFIFYVKYSFYQFQNLSKKVLQQNNVDLNHFNRKYEKYKKKLTFELLKI